MTDPIVEKVACVLVPFCYGTFEDQTPLNPGPRKVGDPWKYPAGTPNDRALYAARSVIAAHLSALADAGMVMVPRELTRAMFEAAGMASRIHGPIGKWLSDYQTEPVWSAMLAAASKPDKE